MTEQLRGLVVRGTDVGDFDRMMTLLTASHGKISVFARGAKRPTSRFLSATQLFCCGDYTLYRGKNSYTLQECEVVCSYFHLRQDLTTLALATYLCDVAADVCLEESDEHSMLQLTLNALWCLEKESHAPALVKGAFEFRCACIIGFLPQLGACGACGAEYGERDMFFDLLNGTLLCDRCQSKQPVPLTPYEDDGGALCVKISNSVTAALRYVITAPAAKQFSFHLEEAELLSFAQVCERYLLCHVEHGYHSLTFYKTIL